MTSRMPLLFCKVKSCGDGGVVGGVVGIKKFRKMLRAVLVRSLMQVVSVAGTRAGYNPARA